MTWRYFINGTEVFPVDSLENSIKKYRDGYFNIRTTFNGKITLINNPKEEIRDYSFIKTLENAFRFDKHSIEVYKNGRSKYYGEFVVSDCVFYDQEKKVELTSELRDRTSDIHEVKDQEINIISYATSRADVTVKSFLVFAAYETPTGLEPGFDVPVDEVSLVDWDVYWTKLAEVPATTDFYVYASERIYVDKDVSMTGWTLLDSFDNIRYYGRIAQNYPLPEDSEVFVVQSGRSYSDRTEIAPLNTWDATNSKWKETGLSIYVTRDTYNQGQFVGGITNSYRTHDFKTSINKLLTETLGEGMEFRSTFLFRDPPATGEVDKRVDLSYPKATESSDSELRLITKSDFKAPNATQGATIANCTIEKVLNYLTDRYNAEWYVDSDGHLRIEHVSYLTLGAGEDISNSDLINRDYEYLSDEIPNRIIFSPEQGWSEDFVSQEIRYGNIPLIEGTEEYKETVQSSFFITDVDGSNQNLPSVNDSGFFLVEVQDDVVRLERGFISGESVHNARMSLSRCLWNFYKHEAYKDSFYINNILTESESLKRVRVQKSIIFDFEDEPDINDTLTTKLGEAKVMSIEQSTDEANLYTLEVTYE